MGRVGQLLVMLLVEIKGKIPVQPDRQTWEWKQGGHKRKKFVLISAAEKYFREAGIDWK